ncbi:MAG: hypothetical protein Q4F95_09885 [Oscillospiraceae bacterium]|nr:hypothetical protein [Oscillospiraceae bacterium]
MPHSSGGGSHSGGSHSSGGSHHSGHSGGGPTISRRPFKNSRRYIYHDRHGMEQSIYCTQLPKKQSLGTLIFQLLFLLPFFAVGGFMAFLAIKQMMPPSPMKPLSSFSDVHISDDADVLDNENKLENTLREFQKTTGICPYIMTVYDSDWKENYDDLEAYSFSLYVNHFPDEQHFLVVYSQPDDAEDQSFVDWSWEGMQGDNTDDIISERNFSKFQNDLQKYLTRDDVTVSEAFDNAFTHSLDYIMTKSSGNSEAFSMIFFCVMWIGFTLLFAVIILKSYIASKRDYQEVSMDYVSQGLESEKYFGPEIR